MRRITTIAVILLAASMVLTIPSIIQSARAAPFVDPAITRASATASPSTILQTILVLDHIPTSSDAQALTTYSRTVAPMTQLPMILITTTYGNLGNILRSPGLVSVWANRPLTMYGNVNTVTHSSGEVPVQHSWWNDIMNVPSVWSLGYRGQGITVALVDTGIDASNPSLGYSFPNGLSLAPYRVIQNVKVADIGEISGSAPLGPDQIYLQNQIDTDTTSGHGTSTSGLVAGTGDGSNGLYKGAAPQAHVVGLGSGDVDFVFFAVASFNYILANHNPYNIRIVSNSWGTDYNCSDVAGNPNPSACAYNTPIQIATKAMHDAGIAVLFAAGNSGPGHPTLNPYAQPAWIIGLGAGDQSGGLADFSSRGLPGNSSVQPNVVAPGINVISTKCKGCQVDNALSTGADPGNIVTPFQLYYTTFGGTSAATPMAAGVGALILSANPSLTPDQLKTILIQTANPMLGYLPFQDGSGYVNALNAVNLATGQHFTTSTAKAQAFGDQRYITIQYIGGAFAATSDWMDGSVPVYSGATSISFNASFPAAPATPLQYQMNIYGPNDNQVTACGTQLPPQIFINPPCTVANGATSITWTVSNASYIASLDNTGFNAGTWTVQVVNFDQGTTVTLTVDVQYPAKASTHMKNAHDITVTDSSSTGLQGTEEAILQTWNGAVTSTIVLAQKGATSVNTDVTQPTNTVINIVQIVTVDSNGNILEIRGGYVATQADLTARATQVQQQLLTTTDPTQILALQTELSAIQSALPNAPASATLPTLP